MQEYYTLPGKAVEKWCLFRILPNLIGQYVPEDYALWQLYLTCRELTEIVLAPAPTKSDAAYLRILIQISWIHSSYYILISSQQIYTILCMIHVFSMSMDHSRCCGV